MLVDYEHYRRIILPKILNAWDRKCFCAAPGFLKLMSFNFEDYGLGPACCFDTENLSNLLIYSRFKRIESDRVVNGENIGRWECPQCGIKCRTHWEDFSISMSRTYCEFDSIVKPAEIGIFILGGSSYEQNYYQRLADFREAISEAEYFQSFDIV